jgi:hypothetical protein
MTLPLWRDTPADSKPLRLLAMTSEALLNPSLHGKDRVSATSPVLTEESMKGVPSAR